MLIRFEHPHSTLCGKPFALISRQPLIALNSVPISLPHIAEGEEDADRSEDENDAIVQDCFARAFLIGKESRAV